MYRTELSISSPEPSGSGATLAVKGCASAVTTTAATTLALQTSPDAKCATSFVQTASATAPANRDVASDIPDPVLDIVLDYANLPLRNLEIPDAKSDGLFFFNRHQLLARKAMDLFLWGRVAESLAIVSAHPHLLIMTVEREGPAGTVKGTIYRAALWADDQYIPDEKGRSAVQAFKELLIQHHGADEEQKQHKAQFPKDDERDWEAEEKAKIAAGKAVFDAVARALDDSKATTEKELNADVTLQKAMKDFEDYFTLKGVNTSGRCCMRQF